MFDMLIMDLICYMSSYLPSKMSGSPRTMALWKGIIVGLILLLEILNTTAGIESVPRYKENIDISRSRSERLITSKDFSNRISRVPTTNSPFTMQWVVSTNRGSYIQVEFIDYDIRNDSYIKIQDGTTPQKHFIFTSNQLPTFQSLTHELIILLKGGRRPSKELHYGIQARLTSVDYSRDDWDVPSSGYCGPIQLRDSHSSFIFQPPSNVIERFKFRCIWIVKADYLQVTKIRLRGSATDRQVMFSVHSGGFSGASADYTYSGDGMTQSRLLKSKGSTFYVNLESRMKEGDKIEIQFSNKSYEIGLLSVVNTTNGQSCPFKTNDDYTPRCYNYWTNPNSLRDESCFALPTPRACKLPRDQPGFLYCYNPEDVCDKFGDCPYQDDEKDCNKSDVQWFAANVIAALVLILVGWGCGCRRRGYERSMREYRWHLCSRHCLDTYCCTDTCIDWLSMRCSRLCSRVRTSCVRPEQRQENSSGRVTQPDPPTQTMSPRMPVVCISAGVDARMHHSHLIQAAAILNRSPGRSDVTTRWDAQPPGVPTTCALAMRALPLPASSCSMTTTSNTATSSRNGLPTYEQVRLADLEMCVHCSSAQGSQVNLLQGQGPCEISLGEPPPAYSDVITTPPSESVAESAESEPPPTYACVLRMSSEI